MNFNQKKLIVEWSQKYPEMKFRLNFRLISAPHSWERKQMSMMLMMMMMMIAPSPIAMYSKWPENLREDEQRFNQNTFTENNHFHHLSKLQKHIYSLQDGCIRVTFFSTKEWSEEAHCKRAGALRTIGSTIVRGSGSPMPDSRHVCLHSRKAVSQNESIVAPPISQYLDIPHNILLKGRKIENPKKKTLNQNKMKVDNFGQLLN